MKRMVRSLGALMGLLALGTVIAASVPGLINYQGKLTDSGGTPLDGVSVDLTFRFYDAVTSGTLLLTVQQNGVVVNDGVFNVLLGSGTVIQTPYAESFSWLFKYYSDVWMSTQVNSDPQMTPRQRIASVPHAFHADESNTVVNGIYSTLSYSNPSWLTSIAGSKVSGNIPGNSANVTDTVQISNGGTGAISATQARNNLALGDVAVLDTVPIANGGTGATTAAQARNNLGLGGLAVLDNETDPQVGTITTNYVPRWDGSTLTTSAIYNNSSASNVGIGIASPSSKLEVEGGIEVDDYIQAQDSSGIQFNTDDGVQRMKVQDSGSVSIGYGTMSTTAQLGVLAEGPTTALAGWARNTSGNSMGVNAYANGSSTGTNYGLFGWATGGAKNFGMYVSDGYGYFADGVGIGLAANTEPSYNLQVGSSAVTTAHLSNQSANSSTTLYVYNDGAKTGTNYALRAYADNGASNYSVRGYARYGTDNYALYGYANYGTNNWGLYVAAGDAYIQGQLKVNSTAATTWTLYVAGDAYKTSGGTSWNVASDARLKDLHGEYDRGLDDILTVRPVRFQYRKDNPLNIDSSSEQVGIVAQEIREVFPEAVKEDANGFLSFNADPVIWAMVNSFKDLKAEKDEEIQSLKAENAAMGQKLADMEVRLAALEQRLASASAP